MSYRIKPLTETESTNDDAKAAARAGEVDGLVIWALKQNNGRGRHGRSWRSPPGNLYASLLVRPKGDAGHYGFVIALAIHEVLTALLPGRVQLKWPNDVLVDGRKIAGVLLERDGNTGHLVIGFGVNIMSCPEDLPYAATCLAAIGVDARKLELKGLLNDILAAFTRWRGRLENEGFVTIRPAWLRCVKGLDERMIVRLPDQELQGRFLDLANDGSLCLQLADGSRRQIASGDVFFIGGQ